MSQKNVWIDIINPSQVLFFHSIIPTLNENNVMLTFRKRGETTELADSLGMKGRIIGQDHPGAMTKGMDEIIRMVMLSLMPNFDYSMSFENVMPLLASRTRFNKSIVICDNDLKLANNASVLQKMESYIKGWSSYLIAPKCCKERFESRYCSKSVLYFDGFKEDVYISSHVIDENFLSKIPFKDYVVVRPEALNSLYVKKKSSMTRDIIEQLIMNGENVIYLPRDSGDADLVSGLKVYIPEKALNGIDLCYYSKCVLTGSGTMAREAACMGKKSVSFFPGNELLSVDRELVNQKRILHSRNTSEIVEYVCKNKKSDGNIDLQRMQNTKIEIVNILQQIIDG